MHVRKVQLIAGSTYTISLPKKWVKENNISAGQSLSVTEKDDSVVIRSNITFNETETNAIIDINKYKNIITQIIYSLYYYGVNEIHINSEKTTINEATKEKIKKTLANLMGGEIIYDYKNKLRIKFFISDKKIDIPQLLIRILLLIKQQISNILEDKLENCKSIESDVNKLNNLITRNLFSTLKNKTSRYSSVVINEKNAFLYNRLLMRLEKISDHLSDLIDYVREMPRPNKEIQENLNMSLELVNKHITRIVAKKEFYSIDENNREKILSNVKRIKDPLLRYTFRNIFKLTMACENDIISIYFYKNDIKSLITSNNSV